MFIKCVVVVPTVYCTGALLSSKYSVRHKYTFVTILKLGESARTLSQEVDFKIVIFKLLIMIVHN